MRIRNRSLFQPRNMTQKTTIKNKGKVKEATVYVYDEIGYWGVTPEDFVKELNDLSADTVHIRFNSPGGSVFDGTAMFNAIKQHKSKTVAHVDGLAASIASVIALGADEVRMAENAFMMIHEPWSMVMGNADDMREEADLLDKVGGTIMNTYVKKTSMKESEIKDLVQSETWMTAKDALEMGFIDSIEADAGDEKAKATLFDLNVFSNVPAQLIGERETPTAREVEKILKNSGFSASQAKEILAKGFNDGPKENQREVDLPDGKSDDSIKGSSVDQREADDDAQREVEETPAKDTITKDKTANLLTRAEVLAPTTTK
jgi:ATP-dependent Clp protease, protease subunit